MSSSLNKLRKRIARANAEHRCAACHAPLPPRNSPEQERQSRAEAYAQGMTDEQIDDPTFSAKICDPCWQRWAARGYPGMTRVN